MNDTKRLQQAIRRASIDEVMDLLEMNPDLANSQISWGPDDKNLSDPLHFVSDCVFDGSINSEASVKLVSLLLESGALINGSLNSESPLIGATSLSATGVAHALIEAGADIELTALFGATALHWASYVGTPTVVEALLKKGAGLSVKCTEFQSTPLFWAVQGFSQYGPEIKTDQVEVARLLISQGAEVGTRNIEGVTAIERSRESASDSMTRLLESFIK